MFFPFILPSSITFLLFFLLSSSHCCNCLHPLLPADWRSSSLSIPLSLLLFSLVLLSPPLMRVSLSACVCKVQSNTQHYLVTKKNTSDKVPSAFVAFTYLAQCYLRLISFHFNNGLETHTHTLTHSHTY